MEEMEDTGMAGQKDKERRYHGTGYYTVHHLVLLCPYVIQAQDFVPFSERNSGFLMIIKTEWQSSVLTTRYCFL